MCKTQLKEPKFLEKALKTDDFSFICHSVQILWPSFLFLSAVPVTQDEKNNVYWD